MGLGLAQGLVSTPAPAYLGCGPPATLGTDLSVQGRQENKSNTLIPQLLDGTTRTREHPEQIEKWGSPFGGRVPQGRSGRSPCPPAPDSELH